MFTDTLHQTVAPIWQRSFDHPFIQQLSDGTLSRDAFIFYLLQDRYYLNEFGNLHGLIAQRLPESPAKDFMLAGAQGLKDGEIAVRDGFFAELGITPARIAQTPVAPTAYNYVNHMYAQLYRGSTASAMAGLLPCYWLYNEIGQRLVAAGSPHPLYRRWIETYDSEAFTSSVQQMIALTNQAAEGATESQRQQMTEAFVKSSAYELAFWQMALDQQQWVA